MSENPHLIHAAVDGSALNNPGPSGWAWYVNDSCWASGTGGIATNNRMELEALRSLLTAVVAWPHGPLRVHIDSKYTMEAVTVWVHGWRRNAWKTSKREPVKNAELIDEVATLYDARTLTELVWVKGHAGHPLNEAADQRARAAAEAFRDGKTVPTGPGWSRRD